MDLMLCTTLDNQDVAGWLMSEKFDGVRAQWTGSTLVTRNGRPINAPAWWVEQLPTLPLDGELWMGRGTLQECSGALRRSRPVDAEWLRIKLMVFDAPQHGGVLTERIAAYTEALDGCSVAVAIQATHCASNEHARSESRAIAAAGGEGVVVRRPDSDYADGRSGMMLKCKPFETAEATVSGVRANPAGVALDLVMGGVEFALGFTTGQGAIPAPGSLVTIAFSGRTKSGVPRTAVVVGVRDYE